MIASSINRSSTPPTSTQADTGNWTRTASRRSRSSSTAAAPSSSRRSRSRRSARRQAQQQRNGLRRRQGAFDRANSSTTPPRSSTQSADHVDQWRMLPESQRLAGDAGDGPPAPALAPPPLQRHPPLLLPGRGGRDRDLADRGRPAIGKSGQALPRTPCQRQQRRQPGAYRVWP